MLICFESLISKILYESEFKIKENIGEVVIVDVCINLADIESRAVNKNLYVSGFQLDDYLIIANDNLEAEHLSCVFFDYVAPVYEQLIDVSRNRENIENLISLAYVFLKNNARCALDFGCGTGLSRDIFPSDIALYGYDPSESMKVIASNRNMVVLSIEDFECLTVDFDFIFASYVLHLDIDLHALSIAIRRLVCGGVLVANFHKGLKREVVSSYLSKLGLIEKEIPHTYHLTMHGKYSAYVKKGDSVNVG